MAEIKFVSKENLLYVWQKIKLLLTNKVDKVEGKGLSTNDLTDELKEKILKAGDSSFSGNYEDLTNKPDLADMATKTYVTQALANMNKKEIVTNIEEMTDANTIYLILNNGTDNNVYDEYIIVNGQAEKIGTTEVDLTNCLKTTDLIPVTNAEIDEIFAE